MNTPTRVAAFVGGLAAVFAAAIGVGTLTGPVGTVGAASTAERAGHDAGHTDTGTGTTEQTATEDLPGGLMVSQDGYTLAVGQRQLPAAAKAPVQFQILGPDGLPVIRYTTAHGKDLHLIVVRRDLTDFHHVHPQLDAAGTWTVPLDLSDAGVYRLFADFTPADRDDNPTLGADLSVTGGYQPDPLPATSRTAEIDGYTVTLDGTLEPGQEAELTLSVSKGGQPVSDLQPYLAAYGHLVALRDGDLADLHVHPAGEPGDGTTAPGPDITFYATAPSAGDYRLFLDFQHGDVVRTAEFSVRSGGTAAALTGGAPAGGAPGGEHDDDGHTHG